MIRIDGNPPELPNHLNEHYKASEIGSFRNGNQFLDV